MKTKNLLFALALATAVTATAQTKKVSYSGLVQTGLLEGERGSAFQMQTVQGLKYKTWSAGIGAGLDYYHTRSVPLFLDLRKTFGQKDKGAFVYADGGYHFLWLTTADKQTFRAGAKGGFYYDAGVGYQFPAFKNQRLFFSAGISGKEFRATQSEWIYIDYIWPAPSYTPSEYQTYFHYRLQRISIKAGLFF